MATRKPGNMNLADRPIIINSDGTVSTIESLSIGTDEGEVLIPTIVNGNRLSDEEAIKHYEKSGEHLGIFDTPEEASQFAKSLSEAQGKRTRSTLLHTLINGVQ